MDLEQYLSSKQDCGSVDADTLKLYAQKAVVGFVQGQQPMNDAIVAMAKEAHLNHEQVKRVVEYANNQAFSQLFRARFAVNITYPMADTSVILQQMESPVQTKQASVELPRIERYVPGQENASLEAAFGGSPVQRAREKVAAPQVDRHRLTAEYLAGRTRVRNLTSDRDDLAEQFQEKVAELERTCQQARNDGNEPFVIGCAIEAKASPELVRFLAPRLGTNVEFGQSVKLAAEGAQVVENPVSDLAATVEQMRQTLLAVQEQIGQAQAQVDDMLLTLQQPTEEDPAEKLFRPGPAAQTWPTVQQPGVQPGQGAGPGPLEAEGAPAQGSGTGGPGFSF